MRKTCLFIAIVFAIAFLHPYAFAGKKFPEKGWHKGTYFLVAGGMVQATDDRNVDTGRKFAGSIAPAVGLIFGWDIIDWMGPQLSLSYGFATDTVGNGTVVHPTENGREHIADITLTNRFTFLTNLPNLGLK